MTDNNENLENENLETQNPENQENLENASDGSENPNENQELGNDSENPETVQEIPEEPVFTEPEPQSNPWDDAPENVYFYEKIYPDGHLGSFTQSAELAYKSGWDIENNYILIEDTQQSDINGWTYRKSECPMKTEQDHLRDQYRLEIQQLKKSLSDTDYKAIKYAEGQISESEYASVKAERQGYRDRINELEALL